MAAWKRVIDKSKLEKHTEIVALLKSEHGMTHGDAAGKLYTGTKAALLPIHEKIMKRILSFGEDVELAPKTGYVSLRRHKQFAMLRPAAKHVDLGLVMRGVPVAGRLESAATFNALFTHRVRLATLGDVDREVVQWTCGVRQRVMAVPSTTSTQICRRSADWTGGPTDDRPRGGHSR